MPKLITQKQTIVLKNGLILGGISRKEEAEAMIEAYLTKIGVFQDGDKKMFSPHDLHFFNEIICDERKNTFWWSTGVTCPECGGKRRFDWQTFGFVWIFNIVPVEGKINISRVKE